MPVFNFSRAATAVANNAIAFASAHKPAGGFAAQNPAENVTRAIKNFEEAITSGEWGFGKLIDGLTAPEGHIVNRFGFQDDSMAKEIAKEFQTHFHTALLAAVASTGPLNNKRYWVLLSDTIYTAPGSGDEMYLFFTLTHLMTEGMHGSLSIYLAAPISEYLEDGGESYIADYLASKGLKMTAEQRSWCFPKAMYVPGFPKEKIQELKNDIDAAIEGMAMNPKGKGVAPVIKFLGTY